MPKYSMPIQGPTDSTRKEPPKYNHITRHTLQAENPRILRVKVVKMGYDCHVNPGLTEQLSHNLLLHANLGWILALTLRDDNRKTWSHGIGCRWRPCHSFNEVAL